MYWKMNYVSSCVSTQRGGVLILFDNSYECLKTRTDHNGRMAIAVIESSVIKPIVVNAYCPNDHKLSLEFIEKLSACLPLNIHQVRLVLRSLWVRH